MSTPTRGLSHWITLPWRCRWNVVRLAAALFILWVLAADTGARLARLQLASLPNFDHAAEARALRLQGRYGEALILADKGLAATSGPAHEAIQAERDAIASEQASWLRRARDVGVGALTGRAQTLEGLIGAVGADFFVVGDLRDLVIQGGRQLLDGESDEVVLALSIVGVVTTLAPEIDWVPSVLKAARRAGHLGEALGARIVAMVRRGESGPLEALMRDVAAASERAGPAGAARLLRGAETPEDVAALARLLRREPGAALALHVAPREGAELARLIAGAGQGEAWAARALARAGEKGPAGVRLLQGAGRAMLRPHPLLGIAKAVWKGNAEDLITRVVDRVDPMAWWLIPAAAAWTLLELAMLWRRVRGV